MQFEYFIGLG